MMSSIGVIATTIVLFLVGPNAAANHFILPEISSGSAHEAADCQTFAINKGDGEGVIRHCIQGQEQTLYFSGDLDTKRDFNAVRDVIQRMKNATQGRFKVITKDAGGGDVEWHQKLMMAVEDHCIENCRIQTEVHGRCESACNQLHLTCVRGATTKIMSDGKLCEHASTDGPGCNLRDPKPPYEANICGPTESIQEYTQRCGELLKGRSNQLDVDPERKQMIREYALKLADMGAFDSSSWTCRMPPWAEPAGRSVIQHALEATK